MSIGVRIIDAPFGQHRRRDDHEAVTATLVLLHTAQGEEPVLGASFGEDDGVTLVEDGG